MGVTMKQAAERLGVSKQMVHKLIGKGRIGVVSRGDQARAAGRFAGAALQLDEADVEREAKARGR